MDQTCGNQRTISVVFFEADELTDLLELLYNWAIERERIIWTIALEEDEDRWCCNIYYYEYDSLRPDH